MIIMILLVVVLCCAALAAVIFYAGRRWRAGTRALRGRLEAARRPFAIKVFDPRELEPLPPPVQRFFSAVLGVGQPMVAAA